MTVPSAGRDKNDEEIFENHHARFVARVWIIRDGQTAPPNRAHHRWIKVEKCVEGDPKWMIALWLTWSAVWKTVETQVEGGAPYTLRL